MSSPVQVARDGHVLVVTIDNPPVNALGQAVRAALFAAAEQLDSDDTLHAMMLCSVGNVFIGGADIREFSGPRLGPQLNVVCHRLEACTKPIVAAIHGAALGGGFEVALASHYRVASPNADVAFPEVLLGLLPGAGGTQRAPRLAGAAIALDLMLTGRRYSAPDAQYVGLIDRVEDDVYSAALAWAHELAAQRATPRRARDGSALAERAVALATVAAVRATIATTHAGLYSPARICDCVEAAITQSFDDASAYEANAFLDCLASPQRAVLVEKFFAERAARKMAPPTTQNQ